MREGGIGVRWGWAAGRRAQARGGAYGRRRRSGSLTISCSSVSFAVTMTTALPRDALACETLSLSMVCGFDLGAPRARRRSTTHSLSSEHLV